MSNPSEQQLTYKRFSLPEYNQREQDKIDAERNPDWCKYTGKKPIENATYFRRCILNPNINCSLYNNPSAVKSCPIIKDNETYLNLEDFK